MNPYQAQQALVAAVRAADAAGANDVLAALPPGTLLGYGAQSAVLGAVLQQHPLDWPLLRIVLAHPNSRFTLRTDLAETLLARAEVTPGHVTELSADPGTRRALLQAAGIRACRWAADAALAAAPDDAGAFSEHACFPGFFESCVTHNWADLLVRAADAGVLPGPAAFFRLNAQRTLDAVLGHPALRAALVRCRNDSHKTLMEVLATRKWRRGRRLLLRLLAELTPAERAEFMEGAYQPGYGPVARSLVMRMAQSFAFDGDAPRPPALRAIVDACAPEHTADARPAVTLIRCFVGRHKANTQVHADWAVAALDAVLRHERLPPISDQDIVDALHRSRGSSPAGPEHTRLRRVVAHALQAARTAPLVDRGQLVDRVWRAFPDDEEMQRLARRFGSWGRRRHVVLLRALCAAGRASTAAAGGVERFIAVVAPRRVVREVVCFL